MKTKKSSKTYIQEELNSIPPELQLVMACARTTFQEVDYKKIKQLLHGGINWDSFIGWVERHEVIPLVHQSFDKIGKNAFPEYVRRRLSIHSMYNSALASEQIYEIIRISNMFTDHNIPVIPLKGPVLSWKIYGNLSHRQVGDIDLLIPFEHMVHANELLCQNGYHNQSEIEQMNFTSKQRQALFKIRQHIRYTGKHTVELHWRLLCNRNEEYWHNLTCLDVKGTNLTSMGNESLFLYLCAHGARHWWFNLKWLCDIHQILSTDNAIEWAILAKQASIMGNERSFLQAVWLSHTLLDSPLPTLIKDEFSKKPLPKSLMLIPVQDIKKKDEFISGHFRNCFECLWRDLQVQKSIKYKCLVLYRFAIETTDWNIVRLPNVLFPLYIIYCVLVCGSGATI